MLAKGQGMHLNAVSNDFLAKNMLMLLCKHNEIQPNCYSFLLFFKMYKYKTLID